MPDALERKNPTAPKELAWQYIFPAKNPAIDPRSGSLKRHYRHESFLQKAVKNAVRKSQITKMPPVTLSGIHLPHIFLKMAMIFAQYRSYWVIKMFVPR